MRQKLPTTEGQLYLLPLRAYEGACGPESRREIHGRLHRTGAYTLYGSACQPPFNAPWPALSRTSGRWPETAEDRLQLRQEPFTMAPVGEQLRSARLARNLTIEEIAAVTKIRPGFLKLLEEGQHEKLPGKFFVVSFVHQYATALGIDVDATIDALRNELPETEDVPLRIEDVARSRSIGYFLGRANSRIGRAMRMHAAVAGKFALAVLLIGGSFFWLFKWYSGSRTVVEGDPMPDAMQAQPAATLTPADVAPTPDPFRESLNVEILATDSVWVRSLSDGTEEREVMLQAGDRQRLRGNSLVQLTFGNAGGVVLMIDGEEQGAIGPLGQVRHIRITKDGWELTKPGEF